MSFSERLDVLPCPLFPYGLFALSWVTNLADQIRGNLALRLAAARHPPRNSRADGSLQTSTSRITSSSSYHVREPFPIVLYRLFFTRPTIHPNCPPHQGALLRLNCHLIPWWDRKFFRCSFAITVLHHLAAATKV